MKITTVEALLERHEGRRARPYDDFDGRTLVRGHTIRGNPTIGVGWNLTAHGLPDGILDLLEQRIIHIAATDLGALLGEHVPPPHTPRWAALISLAVNLGRDRLRGFRGMIAAVRAWRWNDAADELLYRDPPRDTRPTPYAARVGERAVELAEMLRDGAWPNVDKEER